MITKKNATERPSALFEGKDEREMSKYEYEIEKHVTTEWVVTCRREGENLRAPIAKCNSQAKALTIKGLYEEDDKRIEDEDE